MLVLYPICAVMIAGGRLASKIILSTGAAENNLFIILIAMVAEAGPLFLIPGLTRNAYRATGQLGTALNGLRARWTGGARNAVRGNQAYQRAVARGQRNRATGGLSQRRINQYNASAAKTPGARNLRDRWNLRAGNRERIATLNQAALKAEEERRGIDQMSDATQVAGMRAQARISHAATQGKNAAMGSATDAEINAAVAGAATQAQISANQQMVNNADYANATFANAVIQQNTVDHENSTRQQLNWNNLQYRQGKRNAGRLAAENDLESTTLMHDRDFVEGKRQEARLGREGERARAGLYGNADYITSRRNQQAAVISGELTKMYSDQFSRMSTGDLLNQFDSILKSPAGTENHAEQFSAAFSALTAAGQLDKARETLHNNSASVNTLMQTDAEFRTKAMQQFGASGDVIMQEYAKHIGTRTNPADIKDFATWANDTSNAKNSSLRASLSEKGLDRVDKDGFEFLTKNAMNAMAGASDSNIAKVAASTTDAATVAKLADAISKLDASRRSSIMAATSGAQFVNMNETIRVAISGGGAAGDAAWKSAVGAALAADPQLRGKLNATEQGRYAGRPEETFSDGGGI